MDAPKFCIPYSHLPANDYRYTPTAGEPYLLFKQAGTDKGLAACVYYYWMLKKVTATLAGTCLAKGLDYNNDPPTPVSQTVTVNQTYTLYDAATATMAVFPDPPPAEADWPKPLDRVFTAPLIGYQATWEITNTVDAVVSAVWGADTGEIFFSVPDDRWAVNIDGSGGVSAWFSDPYAATEAAVTLYLVGADYTLGTNEVFATLSLPGDIFETTSPKTKLLANYNHVDGIAHGVSLTLTLSHTYWTLA